MPHGLAPRWFTEEHISKDAKIRTDGWSTYKSFKKEYPNLVQVKSGKKGENFNDMHRVIMMFKGWTSGMHHSVNHLKIIWMSTPISLIAVLWVNTYSTIYLSELSDITLLFTNMSID